MTSVGYSIIALVCLVDEPTVCAKYSLGWNMVPEACAAAAKATKVHPPKGFYIKQISCQSGYTPDGRDTLS